MKKLNLAFCLSGALLFAVPGSLLAQRSAAPRLRAGAGKVDITPAQSELTISTDSIRDHLYVRAILVDDGRSCAVIVGMDSSGGSRDNVVDAAIAKSAASTKCPAESYIISATHSHSASTGGLGAGAPDAATVTAAIVSAVDMAKAKLAPETRLRGREDHLDGDRPDAQVGGIEASIPALQPM